MVAGLIGVRSVGRRVHPWPLGSSVCAIVVVGFIWIHWGAHWFLVTGFIPVCPCCRRVHPVSLGSLGCFLDVVGFIRVCLVHWDAPLGSSG